MVVCRLRRPTQYHGLASRRQLLDTNAILSKPWKRPTLYKNVCEGYAVDPNFQDPNWVNMNHLSYRQGLYYKDNRIAIPDILGLKIDIIVEHHGSLTGGHMGIDKAVEKIYILFWWPCMYVDIEDHVGIFPACQVSNHRNWKPQGHTNDLTPPTSPWEVVHVDFAGPECIPMRVQHKCYIHLCIYKTCSFCKVQNHFNLGSSC
jgi:hypothetical protein